MIESTVVKTEWAVQYGVEEALLLWWIVHWVGQNEANEINFFDGRYWTYNSKRALSKLFPFWTERQIARVLDNLEEKGAIITGNYNQNPYDRTKWFSISDSFCKIDLSKQLDINLTKLIDVDLTKPSDLYQNNTIRNTKDTQIQNSSEVSLLSKKIKKEEPEWKTNFEEYLKLVEEAKNRILADSDLVHRRVLKFWENLDVKKSLELSILRFWGTEKGWKNKRKSKAKEIDMVETLLNNIDKNRVYLPFKKDVDNEGQEEEYRKPGRQAGEYPDITVLQCGLYQYFPEKQDFPYFPKEGDVQAWHRIYDRFRGALDKHKVGMIVAKELETAHGI